MTHGRRFHPGGKWDGPLRSDLVPKEGDGRLPKLTLGRVDDEAMLAEPLEQLPEVCHVLLDRRTGYEDVV